MMEILPLVLLVIGTFFVAYFVAAIGPTGGLQLAITSATVPPSLVIPIHAWISGVSATFRSAGLWKHIDRTYVLRFVIPSLMATGAAVAIGNVAGFEWIKILIGAYIILDVLGVFDKAGADVNLQAGPILSGAVTGFITAFIGASGPLLWAMMRERFEIKETLSATHSACLVFQHLSKIVLFGVIGFSILQYWHVLLAAAAASLLGTVLGQKQLRAFSEATYRRLLHFTLLASGILIIVLGLRDLMGA